MNILAFVVGIGITTSVGWLLLATIEGRKSILSTGERISFAVILGPTFGMFIVFLSHVVGLTRLNLTGFLAPLAITILLLTIGAWKRGGLRFSSHVRPLANVVANPTWMKVGILLLCIWTALKMIAGAYSLVSVPTYWDDSFNNWNMRGKIFYVTQELVLEIPAGNGVITAADGVSSYPPMLPMMKTWLSAIRGEWSEPLVNGLHLIWFFGLIAAVYLLLRRSFDWVVSSLGVWACVSLPLVLIHGTNPYADIFVAAHIVLVMTCILGMRRAASAEDRAPWIYLFFVSIGLLALTKNEALVLHIPLLSLSALLFGNRPNTLRQWSIHKKTILIGLSSALALALPWILFKWTNGLTFGNAKSISGTSLSFNPVAMKAIWFHLTSQPNWLLLPLALPLTLVAAGKRFWATPEAVVAVFVLANIALQFSLFILVPSLGNEAINQTGLSRGLLHIAPLAIIVLFFAMRSALSAKQD